VTYGFRDIDFVTAFVTPESVEIWVVDWFVAMYQKGSFSLQGPAGKSDYPIGIASGREVVLSAISYRIRKAPALE
jgi:hypothetical protein